MKILMISGSLPDVACGIGAYSARLASGLASVPGVSVQVLTTADARVRVDAVAPAQVLPPMRRWDVLSVAGAMRRARQFSPDVIHYQYPAVGYARSLGALTVPAQARVLARVPVVTTIHEWRVRGWHGRLATELVAASSSLAIIPDRLEADAMRARLRRFHTPVEFGEIISTIAPAPRQSQASARLALGIPERALLIGTFGLIQPRHRLEDIVEAQAVLQDRGIDTHFLIIGGNAAYEAKLAERYVATVRALIDQRGLAPRVTWTGYVPDQQVSRALSACDVAVMLYPEGVSTRNTTVQTALEHGLPVISTAGPATAPELRGRSGLRLVPAGSTAGALADAIAELASTREPAAVAPSNFAEQVAWHLELYRRLATPSMLAHSRVGDDLR